MGPLASIGNNITPGPSVIVEDISTFGPWSAGPYHMGYYAFLVTDPDALVMLPSANGIHTWVLAAAVKDPKASAVVRDENLTWEENEAAPHMINMMKVYDWPEDRVDMHIQFCCNNDEGGTSPLARPKAGALSKSTKTC
ncbi:hypothetical protein EDB19DRAFT_1834673 [Suillus lakei]|nr:hypothetical protein EDB19DRAFT_1834673 [Suillus lakei]